MYSAAIERAEYWRLVAYGFLHANVLHLATNMLCLALWGAHLERRVGSFYFLVIYVCALIGGAVVGRYTHPDPYLTVGASGGISGVLGALLCLWVLGKIEATANFFVVNIGLNVALAFSVTEIDWGAHFGGFAFGLIACALIDLLEKGASFVLRCKFPEFVKVNALVILGLVALVLSTAGRGGDGRRRWMELPVGLALAGCVAVKACDILLSVKHGLAILVGAFAIANAALALAGGRGRGGPLGVCVSQLAVRRPGRRRPDRRRVRQPGCDAHRRRAGGGRADAASLFAGAASRHRGCRLRRRDPARRAQAPSRHLRRGSFSMIFR